MPLSEKRHIEAASSIAADTALASKREASMANSPDWGVVRCVQKRHYGRRRRKETSYMKSRDKP